MRRFPVRRADRSEDYLGPGYYNMPREFDGGRYGVQGAISKEQRFKKSKDSGPGPGDYSSQESNPWNKKTYNLLFNTDY